MIKAVDVLMVKLHHLENIEFRSRCSSKGNKIGDRVVSMFLILQ